MFTKELQLPVLLNTIRKSLGGYVYKNGVLLFDVPGFSKEDIEITIEENIMQIYGKKEILGEEYEISKKFSIPYYYLDSSNPIKAKVENGLLFIELTKSEKNKQTKVEIS